MKQNKTTLFVFILLIVLGALCRPLGFAPQLAMALFGGAVIKDKKWAFALPVFSMFISDAIFELLTRAHVLNMPGFYQGQLVNYLLIASVTFIGMAMKRINVLSVALASVAGPVLYFVLSNFTVWATGGLGYTMDISGLTACYTAAMPFFKSSLINTVCFSALMFGGYYVAQRAMAQKMQQSLV